MASHTIRLWRVSDSSKGARCGSRERLASQLSLARSSCAKNHIFGPTRAGADSQVELLHGFASADRPGRSRLGGPRRLAMAADAGVAQAELAHRRAVAPNAQLSGGPAGGADDQDDLSPSWNAFGSVGN